MILGDFNTCGPKVLILKLIQDVVVHQHLKTGQLAVTIEWQLLNPKLPFGEPNTQKVLQIILGRTCQSVDDVVIMMSLWRIGLSQLPNLMRPKYIQVFWDGAGLATLYWGLVRLPLGFLKLLLGVFLFVFCLGWSLRDILAKSAWVFLIETSKLPFSGTLIMHTEPFLGLSVLGFVGGLLLGGGGSEWLEQLLHVDSCDR